MVRPSATAKLLIIGQAPGTRVQEASIPWDDRSDDELRAWLALDRNVFYDYARVVIVPMGFCYPSLNRRDGDEPPRPECAPTRHDALLDYSKRGRVGVGGQGVCAAALSGPGTQTHADGNSHGLGNLCTTLYSATTSQLAEQF